MFENDKCKNVCTPNDGVIIKSHVAYEVALHISGKTPLRVRSSLAVDVKPQVSITNGVALYMIKIRPIKSMFT